MLDKRIGMLVTILLLFAIFNNSNAIEEKNVYFYIIEGENAFEFIAVCNGTNYTWDFGDGSIGYGKFVNHSYSDGEYNVRLIVKDNGKEIVNETVMFSTYNTPPTADFYYSPEYPYTLETVYFWDNSTDPDGYIINWTWYFGDGSTGYGKFVSHVYAKAGKYNVTLIVVDNNYEASHVTKQIIVRNRLPIAKFRWTRENETLMFYDMSYDEDGYIVNYTWYFGDGTVSYERNPSHQYAKDGTYTIKLVVRDDDGGVGEVTKTIRSDNKLPTPDFVYTPAQPTDLDNITFTSISYDEDGEIINHTWYFGDGSISYEENPTHRYADNGVYTVTLLVVDDEWAFNYTQKRITVLNVPPVANFTWEPLHPVPGRNVTFNASLSYDLDGNIVQWKWDFGDGFVGFGKVVKHKYASHGLYNITLTVYDNDGANSSKTVKILIADLYVDDDVYDPANNTWNKIQDAIDNATDGAFIYVMEGVYNENVNVDKEIELYGEKAIVNGTFNVIKNGVIIRNFTIQQSDNGIILDSDLTLIKNCVINTVTGIKINGNENILDNLTVNAENASILIFGDDNVIENSQINGIYGCKIYGNGNEIIENKIESILFGVYLTGLNNLIYTNDFINCQYAVYTTAYNIFENNTFNFNGYGIKDEGGAYIFNNDFKHNDYGVYSDGGVIKNCTFFENDVAIIERNAIIDGIVILNGNIGIEARKGIILNSAISSELGINANETVINGCYIKNCEIGINGSAIINDTQFNANIYGIKANNATITNSSFFNNEYSAELHHCKIYDSIFSGNSHALVLLNENEVVNNSLLDNENGIEVIGRDNILFGNFLQENNIGIKLEGSFNLVQENNFSANTYGMINTFAPHNVITNNEFYNNEYNVDIEGSKLEHFFITLETNWINGREVIYLINSTNAELSENYGYIGLINCQNITLNGEKIDRNGEGLLIVYSRDVFIKNCTFNENIYGIYMLHSNFVELENVSMINNEYGFSSKSSKNITIINALAKHNQKGINIFSLEKSKAFINMRNCIFTDNLLSINIENVENVSIENIELENGSIRIYNAIVSFENGIINDELQANKASLMLNNISIVTINATSSNVWIMKLIFNNSYTAIKVDISNLSIKNSIFSCNNFAIHAKSSSIIIEESTFTRNNKSLFENCEIYIENSTFSENNKALEVKNSSGEVLHSIFSNNSYSLVINASLQIINVTVYGSDYGILLMDNSIAKNITCYNNTVGLHILGNGNQIQKGLFHHNSKGILINGSENKIVDCSFWRNLYGIIAYGLNNTIYHNNFINNAENARDYGNNTWYAEYPVGGNYWDDYAGNDLYSGESQNESGSDGIGDIPYEFYGSIDKYPLMDFWNQSAQPPNKPPVAAFKFYPQSPFSNENVIFIEMCYDENGKMDIINYTWYFGDGSISYEKNPVHKYSKPGKYNVTLTVRDKAGDNDSITLQIVVRNTLPVANFTWEPLQPVSQTDIEFNASSSYDLDGSIVNYTWYFGDGSTGYGKFVSHKYVKSGEYVVRLTVRDDYGNESYIEKTIKVANREPTANFIYSPAEPYAGEEINFTDLSIDLDGSIVSWIWDFGDGSISYEKNPVHKYSKPGKYNVTLTVKDDEGGKANYSLTIEVRAKETPAFNIYAFIVAIALVIIWRKRRMLSQ